MLKALGEELQYYTDQLHSEAEERVSSPVLLLRVSLSRQILRIPRRLQPGISARIHNRRRL
jgi:hypothetical protein